MMQDKVYMMRFGEEIDSCQALLHPVFKERSKSIENQIKRRAGMAAALLFQYAVYRIFHTEVMDDSQIIEIFSAELQEMPADCKGILPEISYGPQGKPYVKDNVFCGQPLYFNLSHSEDMAVCAISSKEVGIDVQKCKDIDFFGMAKRFFAPEEVRALENTTPEEQKSLFYRLWTYKEAYGKMTGQGVLAYLGKDFLQMMPENENRTETTPESCEERVLFQEFSLVPDFYMTLCKQKQ